MLGENRDQVVALYELLTAQYLGLSLEEAAELNVGELVDEYGIQLGTHHYARRGVRRARRYRFRLRLSGSRFVELLCERRGIEFPEVSRYDWLSWY